MTKRHLPPLNGLRAFEAAARLGSFAAAADELGVTSGAVSQQVRALEARLGLALFERRAQAVAMTRPARELLPALTGAFDAIDAALRRLGRDAVAAPPLRLAAPAGFAAGWLLPRLVRFHRREPAIALMLTATERLIAPAEDAGGDGFDACIRHGRAGWSGDLGCDFLFADRLIPVCSPAYLATQALAAESEDPLAGHVLLEALSAAEAWRDWSAWSGWPAQGARRLAFGDERLVLDAALGGLGIALCDRALVGERLAEGRLVAPLEPHELVRGTAWFLVYARSSRRLDAIAACRDWLLEESDGPLL